MIALTLVAAPAPEAPVVSESVVIVPVEVMVVVV